MRPHFSPNYMKISRKDNDALNTLITINIERNDFENKVNNVLTNKKKINWKFALKSNFSLGLAPGTYLAGFLLKNCADPTNQISISIFLDQIRARFDVFLHFSRIKLGPLSSRYSQSL